MAAMAQTMISVDFPDGSVVSYDRVRRQLILTLANGSVATAGGGNIPARPNAPRLTTNASGQTVAVEDVPRAPVTRTATVMKLGFKKTPVIGTDIWNKRFIQLTENQISYHESEGSAAKGTITLVPGVEVDILQASDPARKDRQEGGHNPGMVGLATMSVGQLTNPRSGSLGKFNCVEVHVPANIGNMMNSVMNSSVLSMAATGARGVRQNVARTYYFSFDSLTEAQEFADAIKNNVQILNSQNGMGSQPVDAASIRGGNWGQLNNAMNMANALKQNMELMRKPETSLEWYRNTLNTQLPALVVYERLIVFYDSLASFNIHPSF
eukprot:gene7820-8633_t